MTRYLTVISLIVIIMAGCSMIDLSTNPNFQAQLDDGGKPATIVHVQEDIVEAEKTLEVDWGNNTAESNVDYTSSPPNAGDVILDKIIISDEENLDTNENWGLESKALGEIKTNQAWQSFKQITLGLTVKLEEVKAGFFADSMSGTIYCELWSAGKGAKIGSTQSQSISSGFNDWKTFDFTSQFLDIDHNTEYWIKIYATGPPVDDGDAITIKSHSDTGKYTQGQFDLTGDVNLPNNGDLQFEIKLGNIYETSGYLTTDTLDLGEVPTVPGEWQIQDTKPDGTALTYEAWSSINVGFNSWDEKTSGSTIRRDHSAIEYNGKMYIFGGYDGVKLNDVWEYDISGGSWTQKTSGATTRRLHSAVVYNGKMYVFGGVGAGNTLWEYDIAGDSWTQLTSGATSRHSHSAIIYNGKMYVFGGFGVSQLNDVWEYDISGDSWTQKTSGATARDGHTAIEYNGKMYIFGGFAVTSAPWEYDIVGDSWTQKTAGATIRTHHSAIVYNGKMYIFGGYVTTEVNDLWEYDIAGDLWDEKTSGASVRQDHSAIIYNDEMYVFGGYDGTYLNDVWEYSLLNITYLGNIVDGDAITDLKQYYRVKTSFSANTNRDKTPTLHSIKADFSTQKTFTDCRRIAQENDYEMGLMPISGISSEISDFKESTIGQITPVLDFNESISKYLYSKYPKNKIVRVLIGFDDPAFPVSDFLEFFRGQIVDYNLTSDDKVALITQAFQVEWNKKVPETWEYIGDDVTWTDMHPIDVMLDIIRNYMTVRDSKIVASSFAEVKALIPSFTVTRTITKNPVEAKKLMEELRLLTSSYFLPRSDGKIKIKRFDPSEAVVATLTDANTKDMGGYKGNLKTLINKTLVYFAHDGEGDDAADYAVLAIDVTTGADSHDNWGEWKTKEIKDKWTLEEDIAQVVSMSDVQLARYKNPPPIITRVGDKKLLYIEAGDMVAITIKRAPSADGVSGIVDKKFQVIKPSLDFKGDKVTLMLLEV